MNKYIRILIVFIIVVVMFALTWRKGSLGAVIGDSFSTFENVVATPTAVAENVEPAENTASMHNLVFVEFFAGY